MLHQIIIFKNENGIVLFDKSLTKLCENHTELGKEGIGMFFIALKGLINEIITKKNTELEEIILTDYSIFFKTLVELECVLVFIVDKGENRKVNKIFPKIEQILGKNKNILIGWNGDITKVKEALETPIQELLINLKYLKEWIEFLD